MRFPIPAAAFAALLLGGALRAPADSFTGSPTLAALEQHCIQRQGTILDITSPEGGRLYDVLDRAAVALRRPSRSPAGDLAVAGKVAALLEGAYPGDGEFGADLDAALAEYRAAHAALFDRLEGLLERLPTGGPGQVNGFAAAERAIAATDASDAAAERVDRARGLAKAVKLLDRAWVAALALKGREGKGLAPASASAGAATIDGIPHLGDAITCGVNQRYGFFAINVKQAADAESGPARTTYIYVRGISGPGSYLIRTVDIGINFSFVIPAGIIGEPDGLGGNIYFATQASGMSTGLLTITTLDLERRLAIGTFQFKAQKPGGVTRTVTEGSFRSSFRILRTVKVAL